MNVKTVFKNKKVVYGLVAVVIIGALYFIFFNKTAKQETVTVHLADFLQQVSVSGKVVAIQNLDLSFEQAGTVRTVLAKEGDEVKAGKLLASQDTAQLFTQLAEIQAGVDLQKAKLNQLLAGASDETINIKYEDVVSAKKNLANAYQGALVTLSTSYNAIYNAQTAALYVKNTYFSGNDLQGIRVQDAKSKIDAYLQDAKSAVDSANTASGDIDGALANMALDLANTHTALTTIRDQCDQDVYLTKVLAADKTSLDTQKINSNTALTSIASTQQSIDSYKSAVEQAKNNYDLVRAPAR